MTDELRNQVSAYLDQELPEAESELFVRRLCVDGEMRETLGRFSLIGDAIRGDSVTVPAAFASRVAARLEGEMQAGGSIDRSAPPAASAGRTRLFRPLAAAAIAVAVAATALLSLNTSSVIEQDAVVTAGATPPVSTTVPEPASFYPLPASGESYTVPAAVPVSRRPADDRAKLRRYLVTHTAHAATGRQGMLSYRAIGMQGEQPPRDEEPATR